MKKLLLLFVVLVKIHSAAQCSTISRDTTAYPKDTMCFPVEVIQKLLIAAEQKKNLDSLNGSYRIVISKQGEKIDTLQKEVTELKGKDTLQNIISGMRLTQSMTLMNMTKSYSKRIDKIEADNAKAIKKEFRKRRATAAAGILATGLAFFIGLKL